MTVQDLIEHLQTLPDSVKRQDVGINTQGDYSPLEINKMYLALPYKGMHFSSVENLVHCGFEGGDIGSPVFVIADT